ncbi:hypothetical protein PanWU01x14_360580, partial [Parasponia andersonii]
GEGPAVKFELKLAIVQPFYSSRFRELTEQLNARAMMAEQSEVTLAALRVDFDLYRILDEARVSSAVAHALSIERARREELATRLVEVEGKVQSLEAEVLGLCSEAEVARLAQAELKVREQKLQSAGVEMGLAFIARDKAVDEAKEVRKAEAKAKLDAHFLQRGLDWSNEVIRYLYLDNCKLMEAHVELTRKHSEDLADINTILNK